MTTIAPHPFGHTITQKQLIEQFSELSLWEDRYRQLILLSRQLPTLAEEHKQQHIEIKGCENKVWISYQVQENGTLHFYGDSEGRIVKGLLAILLTIAEGLTPQQILDSDFLLFYQQLGIYQGLSASRGNGLQALIDRIKQIAQANIS